MSLQTNQLDPTKNTKLNFIEVFKAVERAWDKNASTKINVI